MHCLQLANTIKSLCSERHIAISKMLTDCSISRNFIYDLEKHSKIPSSETLEKIADYFNVSTDYILGRTLIYDGQRKKIVNLLDLPFYDTMKNPDSIIDILNAVNKLNSIGKTKTLEYVNDLIANPMYVVESPKEDMRLIADDKKSTPPIEDDDTEIL